MSIDGLYIGQRRVRPSIQKIGRCGRVAADAEASHRGAEEGAGALPSTMEFRAPRLKSNPYVRCQVWRANVV